MAVPVTRAVGNLARANPRMYSTSETSFVHRHTPPMPSAEPLLSQPKSELVTLFSHRVHSVLGSAWRSLTNPMTSWMPKKAPKAPLIGVAEMPQFVERALAVVFESERGWSWGDNGASFDETGGRVMLYNVVPPSRPTFAKVTSVPEAYESPASLFGSSRDLYLGAASDVAINTTPSPSRFTNRSSEDAPRSFVYDLYRPHVALIRLPNSAYRGLDDGLVSDVQVEAAPAPLFASDRAQLVAIAVAAAATAVVTSIAAVSSFIKKPW